jgi:hypothetical protein
MTGYSLFGCSAMNDNDGALAVIIIGQWVTVSLLALILWRIW